MATGSVTYKGGEFKRRAVWFTGSGAVTKGYGYAYNQDVGTAANLDEERNWQVEVLTPSNCHGFAGVAVRSYAAKTGGQLIEIFQPGGLAEVYTSETSLTVDGNKLHVRADGTSPGVWVNKMGIRGKGSAWVLQTKSAAGNCLVYLDDGPQNGCVEILTLTAGGATTMIAHGGTSCFATATLASDATFTLANGDFIGQLRSFQTEGTLTTNDALITVTSGIRLDGTTALATWEGDADGEDMTVEWRGSHWHQINTSTGTYT